MAASKKDKKPQIKTKKIQVDEIAVRRAQVSEWYFEGMQQNEMAVKLNVSPSLISQDIAALRDGWLKDQKNYFYKHVNKELSHIEWLEREATFAWERSKTAWDKDENFDPKRGDSTTTISNANGVTYKGAISRLSHGNPKYLEQIRWCIEQRCKLLGLIVERHQHSGEDGKPIPIVMVKMPLDEL